MVYGFSPLTRIVGLASGIAVKSRRMTERRLIAHLPDGLPNDKVAAALEVLESIYAAMNAAGESEHA